ncbi:metalloregulator ArsR/SmtB family transcription factor [bacterium]|nr:metalloregulator ArsR/SmtB family transcription factor [bacterium]
MEQSTEIELNTKLARFAKALSHPVRIYILELLNAQACCYSGDLAENLPIARSTLSQHLKELKDAGLIQGEINPPKIKYCINHAVWSEMRGELNRFLNTDIKTATCHIDSNER